MRKLRPLLDVFDRGLVSGEDAAELSACARDALNVGGVVLGTDSGCAGWTANDSIPEEWPS